jgi:hypothetical protein
LKIGTTFVTLRCSGLLGSAFANRRTRVPVISTPTYDTATNKASLAARIKARAPTYWRYLREEPSWILMFLFARTLLGRRIERRLHRADYGRALPAPESALGAIDLNAFAGEIVTNGVAVGLQLPQAMVHEILDFAATNLCFSRDRQTDGFLPKDIAEANGRRDRDVIAAHYFEAVEKSRAIVRLSQDAALLSVARAYIGSEPVLIRIRLWWSFPAKRLSDQDLHSAAQEKYHFDMNGWRTLKFFFYLTQTNGQSGAHRCIPGSHVHRPLKHQLTLTVGRAVEELEACFGKDRFLTISGDAGFGFAEDPFLFHTGSLCKDQPRLILEIEYGSTTVSPSYTYGRLG